MDTNKGQMFIFFSIILLRILFAFCILLWTNLQQILYFGSISSHTNFKIWQPIFAPNYQGKGWGKEKHGEKVTVDSGISVFTFVIRSLWLKVVEVFIQFFHCFLLPLSKTIKISENCEIFRKFFSVIVVVDVRRVRVVVFTSLNVFS